MPLSYLAGLLFIFLASSYFSFLNLSFKFLMLYGLRNTWIVDRATHSAKSRGNHKSISRSKRCYAGYQVSYASNGRGRRCSGIFSLSLDANLFIGYFHVSFFSHFFVLVFSSAK